MYYFCPMCGNALDLGKTQQFPQRCSRCAFVYYNNPRPVVLGLYREKEKILLTRRKFVPHVGTWGLPGGFVGYGESPRDALRRELLEELGCEVHDLILLETYHEYYPVVTLHGTDQVSLAVLVFSVVINNPETLTPQDDVSEIRFFDMHELPEDIAFPCLKNFLFGLGK